MEKHQKSGWRLVSVDELPVPSMQELAEARGRWIGRLVWFYVGGDCWRKGRVDAITRRGEVYIAVKNRAGEWVHGRVIRLEYAPRVLRLASSK
jgi:hypothetical protein